MGCEPTVFEESYVMSKNKNDKSTSEHNISHFRGVGSSTIDRIESIIDESFVVQGNNPVLGNSIEQDHFIPVDAQLDDSSKK